MLVPRLYTRRAWALAAAVFVWLLVAANRAVVPWGKPSWAARFGKAGPAVDRDYGRRHTVPTNLTLHIVSHSHSDIGWNYSVGDYYTQWVRHVLRNVVAALWLDRQRKFTWGDAAFLDLWLDDEGNSANGVLPGAAAAMTWRAVLGELIARRQMAIVGATYVSPDEGLTTWWAHNAIVDVGRRFVANQLNTTTRVAWQVDPFGHAHVTPHLLANTGFTGLIMGRMDYRQRLGFASGGDYEFLWQAPYSRAPPLLAHYLSVGYAAPSRSFDFDNTNTCDAQALLDELVRFARTQVSQYPGHGHVLVMMGDDFRYINASHAFACLDRIVAEAKTSHQRAGAWRDMTLRYSTPVEYLDAIQPYLAQIDSRVAGQSAAAAAADPTAAAEKQLRLHRGDFYPYQDKPYEQYWSGMFTSRPVLKRLVRSAEQAVQHTEALVALARVRRSRTGMDNGAVWEALDRGLEFCRKQVAIGYHHDAVTGTCSRGAADDYEQRLNAAHRVAIRIGSFALQMAHANAVDPEPDAIERAIGEAKTGGPVPGVNTADDTRLAVAADGADTQAIVVTNANHMMAQDQTVRLLVPSLDLALVDPMTRRAVDAAVVARPAADGAGFEVDFAARSLPPLGWRSYVLANATTAARDYANVPLLRDAFRAPPPPASGRPATKAVLKRDGMHVHLNLDRHSGRVRIALGSHKVVHHQLRQYPVNPRVQPSGAYVMHSFILMYAIVFYVFGGGLCTGLAASVYLRSWRAKNNYQPARRAVRSPILATAMGAMGGLALVYYVEQVASIDTLDRWAGGSLTAPAGLAVFSFIVGYVVSVSLGARARLCVLFVYGVAAAIVMVLFGVPTWQSRPLALEPTGGFRLDVGGPVCDSATVDITADSSVTYRLCTGRANMVEVTAHVRAAVDREVVAHFALNGGGAVPRVLRSCEFDMFDGVGVARRRYSRWTPVPGNYYPAVSHVALASGGLQLHSRQATGATCIAADTLEVGIHRSLSANDFRGLNEPLVDNTEATVTHYIDVGVDRMPGRSGVLANAAINAPALAFVLPLPDNANAALASYSGLGETSDAAVPGAVQNGCVRIVGIQSDESYQRLADDRLDIYARVQMLPGDARCLSKHGAEGVIDLPRLLAVAQHQRVDVFAAEPGDWSIGEWQRLRSEQKVERIRLQPGEQALFRFAIHPLGSEQIGS